MATAKRINIVDQIQNYDENFIKTISLEDVTSNKELKELVSKLETANYVVTSFYQILYHDYIMAINSDCAYMNNVSDIDTLKKYKSLASRIQKAYNYVVYMFMFNNPFKHISK